MEQNKTEIFIQKAKKIFPQYDYSKVSYIDNKTKVSIMCPIHGEFLKTPSDLLQNHGCKICGYNKAKEKLTSSSEIFIQKAKKIFPQYDYSLVDYVNSKTNVKIICSKHGLFEIKPNNLLNKHGCIFCGNEEKGKGNKKSQETFIIEAKKIFPHYEYNDVIYINRRTKINIICPLHGRFTITPMSLLEGHGCKQCSKTKLREKYFLGRSNFISRAILIHPEYDYSNIEYVNIQTKVCVTCPTHGDFYIRPECLLRGQGCAYCSGHAKSNTKDFISKAKLIHPEYIYDKVEYINSSTKITITCPKHGDFLIRPSSVLQGYGCPKCSGMWKPTTEEFIYKASSIFPEYNYDKVNYINAHTKIVIKCNKHSYFATKPNTLLNGHGCPICGIEKCSNSRKTTNDAFIEKASLIHPEYNYSTCQYNGWNNKVSIICPVHGKFSTFPNTLLNGNGCKNCGLDSLRKKYSFSKEEFIEKAKIVKPEYDYSKIKYVNSGTKIEVLCKEHGSFFIRPSSILRGQGCAKCSGTAKLSIEDFLSRANNLHPEYDYSKVNYINIQTKVLITCPEHGDFEIKPSSLFLGCGCPLCNISFGELTIKNWLESKSIEYEYQKTYPDLIDIKNLSYDFYIPSKKLLIEFNGEQHYSFIPRFHPNGLNDLRIQFKHDLMKKEYAVKNQLLLLVIPYDEIININDILSENLL